MAEKIDAEIGNLLGQAKQTATGILQGQREKLTLLVKRLLSEETLEGPELQRILRDSSDPAVPQMA